MGVQQHEIPATKEARLRLLSAIEGGDPSVASLESLDVSCRLLGPDRLDAVLRRLEALQTAAVHLAISFNDIGPAGARRLASSAIAGQLESLEISGNELGDEGVEALLSGEVFTSCL